MKTIQLTKGGEAIVDDEDYEELLKTKWCLSSTGYAVRGYYEGGKMYTKSMHRVLMGNPKGLSVDHINGNRLDNRKENLRVCTHQQNIFNQKVRVNSRSGYRGVIFDNYKPRTKKWRATIKCNNTKEYLGHFLTKEEAALAYNAAAIRLFGSYAHLNVLTN